MCSGFAIPENLPLGALKLGLRALQDTHFSCHFQSSVQKEKEYRCFAELHFPCFALYFPLNAKKSGHSSGNGPFIIFMNKCNEKASFSLEVL